MQRLLLYDIDINFPLCCDLKRKIIKHFSIIRAFCLKNFVENNTKLTIVYGTVSAKRKKK